MGMRAFHTENVTAIVILCWDVYFVKIYTAVKFRLECGGNEVNFNKAVR